MKHLLLTTIAAVLLVGCGLSERALRSAALDGNIEAVKRQLAAGANVNAPNTDGVTHLAVAVDKGHKEIVEILIANGADVNARNKYGWTPLHEAASGGYMEIAKLLIAAGANVSAISDGGITPLYIAAGNSHKEIAELLIANGADVNAEDTAGRTPLHYAATRGHKETAELLIAKGANVNANNSGTPLDSAIAIQYPKIADLLRKHGGKTSEELKAAEPVAEAAKPVPPTVKAPNISIHDAAREGNIEAVKQHIAAGTDVNAKDKDDETPLDTAIKRNRSHPNHLRQTEIADLLRKHGGKTGEELKAEGN